MGYVLHMFIYFPHLSYTTAKTSWVYYTANDKLLLEDPSALHISYRVNCLYNFSQNKVPATLNDAFLIWPLNLKKVSPLVSVDLQWEGTNEKFDWLSDA